MFLVDVSRRRTKHFYKRHVSLLLAYVIISMKIATFHFKHVEHHPDTSAFTATISTYTSKVLAVVVLVTFSFTCV